MKTYKYSTKERAERVAKTLGCTGSHHHNEDGDRKYMPCKNMKTFKEKTKKETKGKEEEVTELVDFDGTWSSSDIGVIDPQSSVQGSTITDKIVPMSRNPRDPLLRGWYGYYGESEIKESDMSDAYGFEDTKFMDAKETIKHFQKKLSLDKESAIQRAKEQGKDPRLVKKTPKRIKKKKNFIDRLVLKELEDEISEDAIVKKITNNGELNDNAPKTDPLLLRNINSLKKMADRMGVSKSELMKLFRDE
jgi:hypothetical protein